MTNKEKFKEVFGLEIDDNTSVCGFFDCTDRACKDCPVRDTEDWWNAEYKEPNNLCDSCANLFSFIGCEFKTGIVRTECALYMPSQEPKIGQVNNQCKFCTHKDVCAYKEHYEDAVKLYEKAKAECAKYPWFKCRIECVQYRTDAYYKQPIQRSVNDGNND